MRLKQLIIPFLFVLFLFTGFIIYDDYGVSWDEPSTRERGELAYQYIGYKWDKVFRGIEDEAFLNQFLAYEHNDHGAIFDLITVTIERIFSIEDSEAVYKSRHLVNFIFFWLGSIFFYLLLRKRFTGPFLSLIGTLMLILSPRIFGHAFMNPKDLIVLSFTIISIYTLIRFLDRPTLLNALIHAIPSALAIDVRIVGIIIPAISLGFVILEVIRSRARRKLLYTFLAHLGFLAFFIILFWPYLWEDPYHHFVQSYKNLSHYRWDDIVLFRGSFVSTNEVPWYYIPLWILITTPYLYFLFFTIGFLTTFTKIVTYLSLIPKNTQFRIDYINLAFAGLPIIIVISLGSALYDGWRQMYFVYPSIIYLAVLGIDRLFHNIPKAPATQTIVWRTGLYTVIILNLLVVLLRMINMHPYQHIYFNSFAGQDKIRNFDVDYWGLSFREAMEELAVYDQSEKIKISVANNAGFANHHILPKELRDRLVFVPYDECTYFISNYRWENIDKIREGKYPYDNEVLSIKVEGMKICGVYRINN